VQPDDGGFVVAAGAVELTAKNGSDIYVAELRAPMLLREPGGNFTVETDVTAAPKQYYQGAGLLLWNGSRSYVRLERGYGDVGSIIFEYRDGGKHVKVNGPHTFSPNNIRTDATRVQLQLTKEEDEVSARWRPYGDDKWQEIGTIPVKLPAYTKAGVTALNRAQGKGVKPTPFTARFDYVRTCAVSPG
jgi:regulation of enolase protein 1 (concanavalin A-like superfamily)